MMKRAKGVPLVAMIRIQQRALLQLPRQFYPYRDFVFDSNR